MTDFLIAYDLNADGSPHKTFLTEAVSEGLLYVLSGTKGMDRLPNTTVWGQFDDGDAAYAALMRVVARVEHRTKRRVVIEKVIITAMGSLRFRSDVRTARKPQWTGRTTFETSKLHQLNDPIFA